MESAVLAIFLAVLLCCAHSIGVVIPGGLQTADKSDNETQRAAEFSVRKIKSLSGLSCTLACIDDAKIQV